MTLFLLSRDPCPKAYQLQYYANFVTQQGFLEAFSWRGKSKNFVPFHDFEHASEGVKKNLKGYFYFEDFLHVPDIWSDRIEICVVHTLLLHTWSRCGSLF